MFKLIRKTHMSWSHIKTNNTRKCTIDENIVEKTSIAECFEPLYNLVYKGCYVPLGVLDMAFLLPFQTVPFLTISTEKKKQVYVFCIFYTGVFTLASEALLKLLLLIRKEKKYKTTSEK